MTAVVLLLAAIAAILFYHLVERRHKLMIAKTLGGILLLVAVGVLVTLAANWRQQRRLSKIRVSYMAPAAPSDTVLSSPQTRADGYTMARVTFTLCNDATRPLTYTGFRASGFEAGRSSPHPIARGYYGRETWPYTSFGSDLIIAPGTCQRVSFADSYLYFDSVAVYVDSARFGTN